MLQQGLLTKVPFCPFARLGGPTGERLARVAFAVLIKFSLNTEIFLSLSARLSEEALGLEEEGDQKSRKLAQLMKQESDESYTKLLK